MPQEPTLEASAEIAPAIEQSAVEAESVVTTPEVVAEAAPETVAVEVPIDTFEVAQAATIETTLDKVIEPVLETITLEEAQVPAHPLEAPQGRRRKSCNHKTQKKP